MQYHLAHDRLKDEAVGVIVHALLQRHIYRIVLAAICARVIQSACSAMQELRNTNAA